jgi:hypothetical protein
MQQYLAQARNWRRKMHLSGAYGRKKAQRRDDYRSFFSLSLGNFLLLLKAQLRLVTGDFVIDAEDFELLRQNNA